MQEADLYLYWQHYARSMSYFESGGHQIRVLHPGRFKAERGPDFQSARFELDGVIYQGDVELHCRAQDWYRHQHHLDPAYANVILHLIRADQAFPAKAISGISGQDIITLGLPAPSSSFHLVHPAGNCSPGKLRREIMLHRLLDLALCRFDLRIQQFISASASYSDEQIFHEYLMRALGYPNNCDAFQSLAQRLDHSLFMLWQQRFGLNTFDLFAVFAGQASFLNQECTDDYCASLQQRYRFYQHYMHSSPMNKEQWSFARVRPVNHPHFRLAGWAALAGENGYSHFMLLQKILTQRLGTRDLFRELHRYFAIPCTEYWRRHYALMRLAPGLGYRQFFGRARIMEILINLILPFFAYQAKRAESHGFYQYLQDMYLSLPMAETYAGLETRLPFFKDLKRIWPSQALLQALIYMENSHCLTGDCRQCPLGRISNKSR